jgi:putative glutamine amidotransferase
MDDMHTPPLIGVSACLKSFEGFNFHSVGAKYVDSVVLGAHGVPLLIPALGTLLRIDALIDRLDGLMLTGSPSNVAPHHYDGPPPREGNEDDHDRDATTLPLIRAAIDRGLPLFAICRGIQELNVALGGSLNQHVQELEGRIDHRSDKTVPHHERYEVAHDVALTPGGLLAGIFDGAASIPVNSLHGQGIDRLADRLVVEATAPDGTIEAVCVADAPGFALGVQWHPEWRVLENPYSMRLFTAFGAACRERQAARSGDARVRELA